jgi:hypothetical protein
MIQTKLAINRPGDEYEQEADRVADQVLAMPAHPAVSGASLRIQRFSGQSKEKMDTAPASVDQALASPSRPLEPALQQDMEHRFGHDFSRVQLHSGEAAEESARDVNARAYTVGHNIVFRTGLFAPGTYEGRRLIAHELTHVIQQRATAPVEYRGSGISASRYVQQPGMSEMMLQRQVSDPRRLQVVSIDSARHVRVSEWLVEPTSGGGTARTELYWVDFKVDAKGVVTASVRTVSPDRAYRSKVLRFGDEFRRALTHFSESGVEVTAFEGDWSYMSKNEISENLRVFQEGIAQGLPREEAARSTPTGKVATRSGFEVTSVENVAESQPHLAEEGVQRWRVKAIFRRPPIPKPGHGSGTGGTKAKSLAPVTPLAETVSGEFTSGRGAAGTKSGPQLKGKSLAPVTPPARAVSGEISKNPPPTAPTVGPQPKTEAATGAPAAPKTEPVTTEAPTTGEAKIGAGGTTHTTTVKPAGSVPLEVPPLVTARDLAVEMRQIETTNRRMASAATFARYALEAYNFLGVLEQFAGALNLAAATLAGGPLQKEKQQAIAAVASATELADYYESLDLRKNIPPGGWAAWDGGWYALQQIQFNYYETESHMHDALESVDAALKNIGRQIQDLADAATEKTSALVLTPVSTPYADAYLFADAAGQLRSHLIDAANAYARAHRAIYFSERMAQASIKYIEIRLRQLGVTGLVNSDIDTDDLKTAPLDKFTERQ